MENQRNGRPPMKEQKITPPINGGMGPPGGPRTERVKLNDSKGTILRLLGYLGQEKLMMIVAFVFVIINSSFTLIASYMVRPIINNLVYDYNASELLKDLLLMLVIYIIAVMSSYLQSRIMLEIAQKSLKKLRSELFETLQRLPLRYFDTNNKGELMSRFTNDVDSISQMLSNTCVQLISGIVTLITTTAIMFYTNWALTLVTLGLAPILMSATKYISKKSMRYYKDQQQTIGALNGYIEESITGQKVIKVFNHEENAIEDFKKLNERYKQISFKAQFLSGCMGPVMGALSLVSYVITACIGGLLCVYNGFDVGGYTIFVNYAKSFNRPISDIFNQINIIFSALAGAERVFQVIDEDIEIEDSKNAIEASNIKGEIEFKEVEFGYLKDKIVLKNISLRAEYSQKVAFVGSTGAGKTTITNLLNRFYDIQSGQITIDGVDLKEYQKKSLRQNIAMVLQDTHLFTGSVMENIRYGRLEATDEEVIEAAKVANADQFIRRLENGYQTKLKGDGANLSQGQRQLLNIARAAISKAPILVLDEATSSVDTRTERHIEQALDRLMETRTTFVIAHRLSTVRNSDIIIVLEQGEIIEKGSHEELLELKGKYHSLYTGASKLE